MGLTATRRVYTLATYGFSFGLAGQMTVQHAPSPPLPAESNVALVATQCTCLNLRRITRKVTQRYDEWLAPSGLRATQFSLLGILHAPGEVSISGLAERMDIDRTTLTRNLQLLAEQGLVAIGTGSDPRSRTVSVTPKGRL